MMFNGKTINTCTPSTPIHRHNPYNGNFISFMPHLDERDGNVGIGSYLVSKASNPAKWTVIKQVPAVFVFQLFPETVMVASVGRRIADLVPHPIVIRDYPDGIVDRVTGKIDRDGTHVTMFLLEGEIDG